MVSVASSTLVYPQVEMECTDSVNIMGGGGGGWGDIVVSAASSTLVYPQVEMECTDSEDEEKGTAQEKQEKQV